MKQIQKNIGLGCADFNFAVYIGNTPTMPEYQDLSALNALVDGEINSIGLVCGNGWRKVFNIYAKLLYGLDKNNFGFSQLAPIWQQYRDSFLLQSGSNTALLFSPPLIDPDANKYHIICGKTYAKQLLDSGKLEARLNWLDEEFAVDKKHRLIVCPYFDYRQLSNIKIERLAKLLGQFPNS